MKALIRNCSHGSEIYLVEEFNQDGGTDVICKSSSFQNGIMDLRREMEGFRWYKQGRKSPISFSITHETELYLAVKYAFLEGSKASFKEGYYRNRERIASIIRHYCTVWGASSSGEDELFSFHGDLSLDNVLFTEDGPIIIDWEHFCENIAPVGFDGLYLLFESLWFESRNKIPEQKSIFHLAEMIQFMREKKCLDAKLQQYPLFGVIEFIKSHYFLWGAQLSAFERKLPILMFSEKNIKNIDGQLGSLAKP